MKTSLETNLGLFVVLVIFAAWIIVETLGGTDLFRKGSYNLTAQFVTAQDLKEGDLVKLAGVEIGRVEKIALTTNQLVLVTMRLHPDAVVPTGYTARIKFTGLMGQSYVSLDLEPDKPGGPPSVPGTMLASAEQPDMSTLMANVNDAADGIRKVANTFSGEKISNLLGPMINVFQNFTNVDDLYVTVANLKKISGQIASGQGTVGKVIYDDTLYNTALNTVTNIQGTVTDAREMVDKAREVVDNARAGQGTIGKLLTDDTLYNATTASMTNLNQIMLKINHGQGTVGKLVNDDDFLKNAKVSLQKLDKAADGLEDQGPLSVLGIMANNLF